MPQTLASPSAQAAVAAALATAAALGWLYLRGRIESLEQALALRAAECGVLRSALAKLEQETEASVEEARVTRTQLNESLNAHHESLSTQREALESRPTINTDKARREFHPQNRPGSSGWER